VEEIRKKLAFPCGLRVPAESAQVHAMRRSFRCPGGSGELVLRLRAANRASPGIRMRINRPAASQYAIVVERVRPGPRREIGRRQRTWIAPPRGGGEQASGPTPPAATCVESAQLPVWL